MALLGIPVDTHPDKEYTVSLDGGNYIVRTRYNERDGSWYFDLMTEEREPIVTGKRIAVNIILYGLRESTALKPPGFFIALDTSGNNLDPTLEDFGTRVQLLYLENP